MGEQLRVRVLGGLHLTVGGRPLAELASAKARALLVYLAVTGTAQSRSALAGLLWSDLPEEAARTNLRLVLTKLRRALPGHVEVTRQSVALAADQPVWVDALEVVRLAAEADDPDALLAAVDLCRGEFLAGVEVPGAPLFDQWVVAERAASRATVLGVLDRAVQLARERGDTDVGIQVARRLVALEPLHEEAHRALMWFLVHGGQPSAAWPNTSAAGRCWPRSLVWSLPRRHSPCGRRSLGQTASPSWASPHPGQRAGHRGPAACRFRGSCPARRRTSPVGAASWRRCLACWRSGVRATRTRRLRGWTGRW
jgi:DNA-binding SARP family transcriptional activator